MRFIALSVALLAGCTHSLTFYPRGAGEIARGTASEVDQSVNVTLLGDTYTGHYVQGMSYGFGVANSFGASPAFGTASMFSASNQYSFIATSGSKAIRCDLTYQSGHGNGVCQHSDGALYDLKVGE